MVARIVLLASATVAAACTQKNLDHCFYRDPSPEQYCQDRDQSLYCDKCTADNDGCTNTPPKPECNAGADGGATVADASGDSIGTATMDGSSTSASTSTTATSTGESTTSAAESGPGESSESTAGPMCGNGIKEGDEQCDQNDLGGETCSSLGFGMGTLGCSDDCNSWILGGCDQGAVCGNDVTEDTEPCDGTDLNNEDCAGHPEYGGGPLACVDCQFDYSQCTPCVPNAGLCDSNDECCSESCDALGLGVCL